MLTNKEKEVVTMLEYQERDLILTAIHLNHLDRNLKQYHNISSYQLEAFVILWFFLWKTCVNKQRKRGCHHA